MIIGTPWQTDHGTQRRKLMSMKIRSHDRDFTMSSRYRSTVLHTLGLFIVTAHPASGKELEDREWIEVRTSNFQVRSILSEKDSIKLARNLELLRSSVSVVTNISRMDSPIPIEIYAFRRRSDFETLGIDPKGVGQFWTGLRKNLIIIRDVPRFSETSIMMHEYVHFLLRNNIGFGYPTWFDEGFAEYLSAGSIRAGKFEVGGFPEHRRWSLFNQWWIPVREILSPEDYDWRRSRSISMFYAEAWALVHYLLNRSDRDTSFGQDMTRYIDLVESGMGNVEAFEAAFMIRTDVLDRRLQEYIAQPLSVIRLSIDVFLPDFEPDVISLSREQISLSLGQIALRAKELDSAKHWFTIAANDELARPQAEAGLGDVLKFAGNFEAAQPHFERAVALAPNDPYIQLDIAEYWYDRAKHTVDSDVRARYLARARQYLVKARKLDGSMPETYAVYGATLLMEGRKYDEAISMLEEAKYLLPSSTTVRVMLAEAYMAVSRGEDAVAAASAVLAWSHDESDDAERARAILAKLASGTE
jgi:tetratricopeptide (TPR) repeat protein